MMFREKILIYSENCMNTQNTLGGRNAIFINSIPDEVIVAFS
jgi:hypothetical protein